MNGGKITASTEISAKPVVNCRLFLSLPDKYRIVVHLYNYEDLPIDEIAEVLHVKATTVQTRLARARDKLKKDLKEDFTGRTPGHG